MQSDDPERDGAKVELDRELEQQLRALRVDVAPPAGAEAAVLRALRQRGMLLGGTQRRWMARRLGALPMPLAAAFVLLLAAGTFGGGFAAGRSSVHGADVAALVSASAPRFLLLLYEDAAYDRAPADQAAQRAQEYGEWAEGLGRTARFIAGEELAEAGRLLDPSGTARAWTPGVASPTPGAIAGYFLVEAADLDAAETLARGCPHLAYGGHIEVRPVLRHDATH